MIAERLGVHCGLDVEIRQTHALLGEFVGARGRRTANCAASIAADSPYPRLSVRMKTMVRLHERFSPL